MIGSGYTSAAKAAVQTIVADAWFDAMGNNYCKYVVDVENKYQFNDVALTNQFAVVSALGLANGTPNSHNVFYYPEPVSSGNSYLDSWPTDNVPGWQADSSRLLVSYPIRITKMEQNGFATVCSSTLPGKLVVSIFTHPTIPPVSRFSLPYNDILGEIVYNTISRILFIRPTLGAYLYYTHSPFSSTTKVTTTLGGWRSIDNIQQSPFEILSGRDAAREKSYWLFDYTDSNSTCIRAIHDNNYTMGTSDREIILKQHPFVFEPLSTDASVIITRYNLNIICR